MANAILRGEPNAGNSHVRFGEGEDVLGLLGYGTPLRKGWCEMANAWGKMLISLVVILFGVSAIAESYTWQRTDGGDLADKDNWGGTLPGSGDTATISSEQSMPLTLSSSLTVYNLKMSKTLELALGSKSLTGANRIFFAGSDNEFLLSGGTLQASGGRVFIGDGPNEKNNTVMVSGEGALLKAPESQYISLSPNSGSNTIVVKDRGKVKGPIYFGVNTRTASRNKVLVTGSGTQYELSGTDAVRFYSPDNSFVVSNGASMVLAGSEKWASLRMGVANNGTAGDRNRVVVDDATFTSAYGIWVGEVSSSNVLEVANGGRIFAKYDILLGRTPVANDPYHRGPLCGNMLAAYGTGNYLYCKNGVSVGSGNGSFGNALSVPKGAELTVCGPIAVGNHETAAGNRVDVGGRLVVTNAATVYWDIGAKSCSNEFALTGASASAAFSKTTTRVGASATPSNNLFAVTGGARLALTNASVSVGVSGASNEFRVEDAILGLSASTLSSSGLMTIGGSTLNVSGASSLSIGGRNGQMRLDDVKVVNSGTFNVSVNPGRSATDRDEGGVLEIVNGTAFNVSRLILGDNSRSSKLIVSNATVNVDGDFQPNYKDLSDSNAQIHFYGNNPHLSAGNLNFYGDATYNFHIPREGYALTNAKKAVVYGETITRRTNACKAKPLIRITGVEGPRTKGHWTLMRVNNNSWNFLRPGTEVTQDDIECGPGIRAVVTAMAIEVYVSSQNGLALIVR